MHDIELERSRSGANYDVADRSSTETVVGKQTAPQPLMNGPGGRYAAPRRNHWRNAPAQASAGDPAGEARSVNAAAGRAQAMVPEQHAAAEHHGAAATEHPPATGQEHSGEHGAAAGGPPLARMQAATHANDIAAVSHLVTELMPQLRANPSSPPPGVNEALTAARTWSMERIVAIRARYSSEIAAARARTSSGHANRQGADMAHTRSDELSSTGAVEQAETRMDTECTPYLDALLDGDPQHRYQHPTAAVRDEVFAAVRLHISRGALTRVGSVGAEHEARDRASLPGDAAWCGAFAYTQARMHGGMDPHWAGQMMGTEGIIQALVYRGVMPTTWIWIDNRWVKLADYHRDINSVRQYQTVDRGPPRMGIQPGDIVLKDNRAGTRPDHITTAVSFDGRFLTTVGGNEGTHGHNARDGVRRVADENAIDLFQNPTANDATPVDPTTGRHPEKHSRVHGIGRWSLADYERHVYTRSPTQPTAPPNDREVGRIMRDNPRPTEPSSTGSH